MAALTFEPLSLVCAESVRWLWEPVLPRGKLAVLDGDPGVGKSLLTIDLAARLSRGGALPGRGSAGRPHTTLMLNAEDGMKDTVRPRAEAAGADLDRLLVVRGADGQVPQLPADLAQLEELIRLCEADLVVIDPLMAFLGPEAAANNDQCLRRVLTPLKDLAEQTDCAVVMVRHLRKQALSVLYRGLGGIGIVGASRSELLAARLPADPDRRVLVLPKGNLTGAVTGLGYRVRADEQGRALVEWTGPVDLAAEQLLRQPEPELRPRDRATDWLRRELAQGPRKAADLLAVAAQAGIPERTLYRAKKDMPAESYQLYTTTEQAWYWYDPDTAWPKDAPFRKPYMLPPLDPL